ncbi:hypothetical protein N7G274_003866 [Stereocaulon virgatum]|uniref:Uncharacterized protein n=1 Tax=Stereocaulon virgatum TaxID=373712 RepID=A0ABR4ACI2_9LECA
MPGAFFKSWALWEQLCFALGAGIVLVILLGCSVLIYNHWRLRKYTAIAATKATLTRQMQHTPSARRRQGQEIPFGVRALEKGVEVDGIWISHSNTPANSVPGSPELFPRTKAAHEDLSTHRTSSASNMSHIEMPQPLHPHPAVMSPSGSNNKKSSPPSDTRVPERTHKPPPTSDHQRRGQATYRPRRSSKLRYSDSIDPEDSEAIEALEGRSWLDGNGKRPEGSESEFGYQDRSVSGSGSSSSGAYDASNHATPPKQPTAFLHPNYLNPPKRHARASYELSDIEPIGPSTHDAHVDERGHLLVRNRCNGMTVAYDSAQDAVPIVRTTPHHETSDPFTTPDGTPPDHHLPAFGLGNDSADYRAQNIVSNEVTYTPGHAEPLNPFDGNRQVRRSQIIRKVNSGFEILRPGSLDVPCQSTDSAKWTAEESGNKRQSRKLQKRGHANSFGIEKT